MLIFLGMFCQRRKATFGKVGARVFGKRVKYIAVAAPQQHIRDPRRHRRARRDGQKVAAVFRAGDVRTEYRVGEPCRLPQHRRRNRNVIVARQPSDDFERRVIHRRKPCIESGESLALEFA